MRSVASQIPLRIWKTTNNLKYRRRFLMKFWKKINPQMIPIHPLNP